jgi:beta-N-acetylhexosaminidase
VSLRNFSKTKPVRRAVFLFWTVLLALPALSRPEDSGKNQKALSAEAQRWVERTLRHMTTNEKIGQIVFPSYFGGYEAAASDTYKDLLSRVENDQVGGFILATRRGPRGVELSHVYDTAILTNRLQEAAKIPLLIGADFEHGTVMRVEEGTNFPDAMAVAAAGRPQDAYEEGRITAIEARAIGVHWVFAPVADVNSNPDNPIINIRSFGEDPQKVAQYVQAFVRGVQENGAIATAKHFPGHGDTAVNTHLEMALVKGDRARLDAVELVPFEAAITEGVGAVMTGHLVVPAIEPNPDIPATLSPLVLTDLLRKQLHHEGLVVTDALDMGGVTKGFPPGETAVRALLAGADVLLLSPVPDAAIASLRDAVESGRVPMARLDEAVARVLDSKARLGLYKARMVDVEHLDNVFRQPKFLATAQDIADRGVTLLRKDAGLVPLDPRTTKRVFLLVVSADPDTIPAEPFERELRAQLDTLDSLHVDAKYFRVENTRLPPPESYDLAICALMVRVSDRKGTVGLPANQAEMVHALLRAGKPVIMVGLGSPYLVEGFPEATTWLATFSVQDVAQRATARALLGQVAVSGKLPVSLSGAAPHALHVGDGLTTAAITLTLQPASAEMEARLKPVFELLDRAAGAKLHAFGILGVAYKGQQALHQFGRLPDQAHHSAEIQTPPINDLRRVIFETPLLTTAIARLVQTKQLTLDTPVSSILQGTTLSAPKEDLQGVTVRQILERSEPIIEARIVETLTGLSADDAVSKLIYAPLGVLPGFASFIGWDGLQVHSENLLLLGQLWLDGGIYAHKRLLNRRVVDQFTVQKTQGDDTFTAGWQVSSAPGHSFSRQAYGFTVTNSVSLWIDPDRELCVVFLPIDGGVQDREPKADSPLGPLRAEVHDAIFAALGLLPAN